MFPHHPTGRLWVSIKSPYGDWATCLRTSCWSLLRPGWALDLQVSHGIIPKVLLQLQCGYCSGLQSFFPSVSTFFLLKPETCSLLLHNQGSIHNHNPWKRHLLECSFTWRWDQWDIFRKLGIFGRQRLLDTLKPISQSQDNNLWPPDPIVTSCATLKLLFPWQLP